MSDNKTIFALTTPPGRSGVAIFRISGDQAINCIKALGVEKLPKPRKAIYTDIYAANNDNALIDQAILIYFAAPNSFTGEDVVELHIHGSHAVISVLSEYLASLDGLRIAEPGEFSRRAFENGKMDLTQLEAVADLIDAETAVQHKQALRNMQGDAADLIERWRSDIISFMAQIEAYIDFPDEDLPEEQGKIFINKVQAIVSEIDNHLHNKGGEIIRDGVHVAIIGAPNVGKSSLINILAKRDVAIISDTAGTTRDVLEVNLDVGGYKVVMADTAGIRESADNIEGEGIKRALKRADEADIKICMFDAESGVDGIAEYIKDENSIIVYNKMDYSEFGESELHGKEVLKISAMKNEGINKLLSALEAKIVSDYKVGGDPVFSRARHKIALADAVKCLKIFVDSYDAKAPAEIIAEELRMAARALGSITGHIDVEEILGEIFSNFCIGK